MGGLEALLAGKDPVGALRSIRQPIWAPPLWVWATIAAAWYVICFVSLSRLLPEYTIAPWPLILLVLLMASNAAWGVIQFRMKRYDFGLWFLIPYAALTIAFLVSVRPIDALPWFLFAGYAMYLPYAAAWAYRVWRLNPGSIP